MKVFKKTILIIIVLLIMTANNYISANSENNQKFIFFLKNQGNYFSTINKSSSKLSNQKIYPGSSGYFDIVVNARDYSFNFYYNLLFLNLKNKPQNLYFVIDNEKVSSLEEYDGINGFMKKGKEELVKRIYWYWEYQDEEEFINQSDFSFEMNLIVERENQDYNGNKLPRTGNDIDVFIGIVLAIIIIYFFVRIKNVIVKENNEINKSVK